MTTMAGSVGSFLALDDPLQYLELSEKRELTLFESITMRALFIAQLALSIFIAIPLVFLLGIGESAVNFITGHHWKTPLEVMMAIKKLHFCAIVISFVGIWAPSPWANRVAECILED